MGLFREWIEDAVKIEAKKMVEDTFARENPEQMIRRTVYDSGYFNTNSFNRTVIETAAKALMERFDIVQKKE